jgi:hypothetical protein
MSLAAATFQFKTEQDGPRTNPGSREPAPAAVNPTTANPPAAGEHAVGCPQCGNLESWGRSSWCPECGFYPRLGTTVGLPVEEKVTEEAPVAPKTPRDAWQQMPPWSRVLCVGIVAIVVESFVVSAVTGHDSTIRSIWGVFQFFTGFGVFAMFHAIAAIKASMTSNRMGLLETLLHPIEAWQPTIEKLPGTARRVWLAAWGLTAGLCAMGIIGGIHYSVLIDDWGFKKRVDSALTTHIRNSSHQKAAAAGSSAAGAHTGSPDTNEGGPTLATSNTVRGNDTEMLALDCVVVGYNINPRDGTVANLLLASLVNGELQFVGKVSKGIPEDVGKELAVRLAELKRQIPVVKCRGSANWVKPVVACKANFAAWTDDKMMIDPEFQELMAEIDYVE